MTIESAVAQFSLRKAENDILQDPSLNLWGKTKALTSLQNEAAKPDKRSLGLGDVVRGAVGAGLGYGVGTVMGKMFGVSPGTMQTFRNLGMGLGTLMNTGVIQMSKHNSSNEERDAFRYGFMKAAVDKGLFKKEAAIVSTLHELIGAPINMGVSMGNLAATNAGVLANQLTGMDETDQDVTRMLLEERELDSTAEKIEAQRKARILKGVLDKRLGRA